MSLADWSIYSFPSSDIFSLSKVEVPFQEGVPHSSLLTMSASSGSLGEMYFLPKKEYRVSGHLSGLFRILYTRDFVNPDAEIRLYCMVSQEDIMESGMCYALGLSGRKRATLYKYTQGLYGGPSKVLTQVNLPTNYAQGVLGFMWSYDPLIRDGVLLRGLICPDSKNSQKVYRLFDYLDEDSPLQVSEGEGFGIYVPQEGEESLFCFGKVSLHKLEQSDSQEKQEEN